MANNATQGISKLQALWRGYHTRTVLLETRADFEQICDEIHQQFDNDLAVEWPYHTLCLPRFKGNSCKNQEFVNGVIATENENNDQYKNDCAGNVYSAASVVNSSILPDNSTTNAVCKITEHILNPGEEIKSERENSDTNTGIVHEKSESEILRSDDRNSLSCACDEMVVSDLAANTSLSDRKKSDALLTSSSKKNDMNGKTCNAMIDDEGMNSEPCNKSEDLETSTKSEKSHSSVFCDSLHETEMDSNVSSLRSSKVVDECLAKNHAYMNSFKIENTLTDSWCSDVFNIKATQRTIPNMDEKSKKDLLKMKENISMELLWIGQAITSRKIYLRMKNKCGGETS